MTIDYISVDARALESLIKATVKGDPVAARAAVDEMTLCARGTDAVSRLIQVAKKHERGIVDKERGVAEHFPVAGHLPGSTVGVPRRKKGDPVVRAFSGVAPDADAVVSVPAGV